ncbi:mycothiol system anti-sigma-R factor [Spelaeicoccus albus]|uniref:Mycothiol system anti-sigma-R factor n=1 Tax=Spelaeicoccus albus TaxID=1280376 RepID=A0A7Z0D3C7_9MICO|nr:mycothiol system anti-sigma-R factor [Spelaeicoccus albus]NYI68124.1 mycothiol system anti-sigma-R factor [Spelaeicoccus albus]
MSDTNDDGAPCCAERRQAALKRLYNYLDGELSDSEIAEIRRHLAHCPPCESEYSIESMLKDLVKRSCCETAPEGLRTRIRERIVVETSTD